MTGKHLIISGHVQGVCYRAWFTDLARSLNVKGWVRNRSDGTVEALIHGNEEDIDALIKAAHIGPALADVKNVVAKDADESSAATFEVRATE